MARLTTEKGFDKACRIIQKYYMEQTEQNECVQFYVTHMQPMIRHINRAIGNDAKCESQEQPSENKTEALPLNVVRQQSELLKKWWKYFDKESVAVNCNEQEREEVIKDFLNCA